MELDQGERDKADKRNRQHATARVEKSVRIVHRFARELRPSVLDDLGLLGMRERVEMVGGIFAVESAPGEGTTIEAQIPFRNIRKQNVAGQYHPS